MRPPFKSSSFLVLLLLIVIPLIAISLTVLGTLAGPQSSSWLPILSSPWTSWRVGLSTSYTDLPASSNTADAPSPSTSSIFNGSIPDLMLTGATPLLPQLGSMQDNGPQPKESDEIAAAAASTRVVLKRNINEGLKRVEANLARARIFIREAARIRNLTSTHADPDYVPRGPIYRNANAFHRSYLEMEKLLKIYVYEEGEPPMFHEGPCKSIYSTEGSFIHEMEKGNRYRTTDPHQALVYFLPFSVVRMVQYLFVPDSHEMNAIGLAVLDYVEIIANKHPFWNRSVGADHFMLSCHDWGPRASSFVPHLFNNSIRALCNANTSEGFNPYKDVSFPEINLLTGEIVGPLGGLSPSRRSVLAFFAGRLHGHIRYLLLEQWKGRDQDVQVYDHLPDGVSYDSMLKKSRFCLCPSGYEVASPRVVEAIYAECIPVLISDSYVLPFSDVLNWKSFSVQVPVKEIPNIKSILMAISPNQYLRMQRRIKQVQRHFVVNGPPKRYDVFHMILHSIWLRRLNIRIPHYSIF